MIGWEYVDNGQLKSLAIPSRIAANHAETYIACGIAGLGLIQVPRYDIAAQVANGELVEVLPNWQPPAMPITALYPHRRHLSRRVQAYVEWNANLLKHPLAQV
ncbi:LysR substrate-binding domain-containing protein [Chitinimonas sp. BJB300]|uniref:LysR substrate-binding domain-containing protein n=1 Tax=Chitinimonas sp. BJB300 TaxID=1559339 RepID=UPI002100A712|nr:LysR substrate-binding domain-containing protein [Chitinimonas sp. BJB300]